MLELMAQGLSNAAIAEQITLSGRTVESHVRSIMTKLDLWDDHAGNRIDENTGNHEAFFDLLRAWTQNYSGGVVTTGQFVELAEQRFPHGGLDSFFDAWLNTKSRPACSFP